uniref:Uncharacterized protein n=1 Tax=Pithovirus LCDPAC02 TaxID=2506601 RepID=A0A481YNL4_9VIRU|nr:MAG: hypothetical protein LCDPAC02_01220 [Pithovirus LCDPAC02]
MKKENPFCKGDLSDIINPICFTTSIFINAGGNKGSPCTLDNQCKDWTPFGKIACCGKKCITKDNPFQTCFGYCIEKKTCGLDEGDICNIGSDCKGHSQFGSIECIGSANPTDRKFCVIKDTQNQTLPEFYKKYGSGLNWVKQNVLTHNIILDSIDNIKNCKLNVNKLDNIEILTL